MDENLAHYLHALTPAAREPITWWETVHFTVTTYLHTAAPPLEFVNSVRGIVLTDAGVAVCTNPDASHIFPGGRREMGESIDETLRRELLEETGCEVLESRLIGFLHFHHETPRPGHWTGPYPDMLHMIFAVRAKRVRFDGSDPDGWEHTCEFVPAEALRDLRPGERLFLAAALTEPFR